MNPIWLWGLLGLIIPIGIHLLSRKEGKTIYVGSLRHLVDSNTTRFSSLRLNEILLLLLRLALVTLIVLLLAGLILPFGKEDRQKWLLIERGIENDQSLKPIMDSLQQNGFEKRFFAKDFPPIADSALVQTQSSYYYLLTELGKKPIEEAVILSHTFANHFKGQRIALPNNCKWISVEPQTRTFIHEATQLKGDSLKIRTGKTSGNKTEFDTKLVRSSQPLGSVYRNNGDTARIISQRQITARIFFTKGFEHDVNLITASLNAISDETQFQINIEKHNTASYSKIDADIDIWLSHEPLPENFGKGISFRNCSDANQQLITPANQTALYCDDATADGWGITKRLTQENILRENFTLTVAKIISSKIHVDPNSFPDHRTLPMALAWSEEISTLPVKSDRQQLAQTYLSILLLLTLVAERWMAFKRNQ